MRRVTLTFDNGPEPEVTESVLDSLLRHDVKATFFVLGRKVNLAAGRAICERARAEGHWIGNHTFAHEAPLGDLDSSKALQDFIRAEQALQWLDQPARLFRPQGGGGALGPNLLNRAIVERLQAGGYDCVLWNCVPGDWRDPQRWVTRALQNCR